MIPILYEKDETAFVSNGLGRLRDCISCLVTEERNGIYELDFEYPINGQHFDEIQIGRIVAVEHDDSGYVQPFDIVGYSKPIDGIVAFHCTHISYRQSYMTVNGTNITSLADAFTRLKNNSTPSNPFTYWTDKTSAGYVGSFDGVPKSVRSILGGEEGSILDAYGGEYEWDGFMVKLWSARGQYRDFAIRYGVNMMDYLDETDSSECYSSIIPYWTDGTTTVVGDKQTASGLPPSGREACVPMDVSEKFEDQPTRAQVNSMGASILNSGQSWLPSQNITVSFVRLQDTPEYSQFSSLLRCGLCDTIKVIFPDYNSSGTFKIVRTVWDVLSERYEEMELGDLSISLSEALGISDIQKDSKTTIEQIMSDISQIQADIAPTIVSKDGSTVSLATATVKNLTSVTLDKGVWLCTGTATFAANSSGRRGIYFSTSSGTQAGDGRYAQVEYGNAGSSEVHIQITQIRKITADGTTLYLNGRQNCGSNLNASYPGIYCVRIGV